MHNKVLIVMLICLTCSLSGQEEKWMSKFEQLGSTLPSPNIYRAGDGAPGPGYWQQNADYKIKVILNEGQKKISGTQTITYKNNSPQKLSYLWLQLDQNRRAPHNQEKLSSTFNLQDTVHSWFFNYKMKERTTENGIHVSKVTDKKGKNLEYHIVNTMMRIDLPKELESGKSVEFSMSWWYNLNNRMEDRGRSGFEYFPEDDNCVFTIAQFHPRMAVYDDFEGWQHKPFLGAGEFALSFGNFEVEISAPEDHLLMATGELTNAKEVLSTNHFKLYEKAKSSFKQPVIIASQAEAVNREKNKSQNLKTWKFKAENVRDFAFASSRKFIWDAQAVEIGGKTILAQSLYPREGNPLWEKESTKAVINTLKTYSKYSVPYPYPHATSIHAAAIGMEYPMICFNFGRPEKDGTYSDAVKYGMIGVIIHEVGHNFFPMIVNSDERQWGWMDEGINTFLEFLTEQECYENFPSSRGPAETMVDYMAANQKYLRPIMTAADNIYGFHLGNNAYGKPAAALNILRETVLGRELFDKAFKSYSERWAFKHPKPADFFRSIEDASGVDLDWFWRGWFYSTDPVDIAIDTSVYYRLNPSKKEELAFENSLQNLNSNSQKSVFGIPRRLVVEETIAPYYWEFLERVDEPQFKKQLEDKHIYKVKFANKGGLIMPIIVEFEFESGQKKKIQIPAEVWRKNEYNVNKVFVFDEKVKSIVLDPNLETADIDKANGYYPNIELESQFEKFKNSSK